MFIQFLGTSAGSPSINRNVTSIALIINDFNFYEVWLFDCGESTQNQILRTSIKLSKISKIFITHMHGDHIFGLPGLLTSRSINNSKDLLEIYGCKGIKYYVEMSLKISHSFISFPLNIIEINEGEIFNNSKYRVVSFSLNHSLECYGFRIEEIDRVGHLNVKKLISDGINPGPIYKFLKFGKKILLSNGKFIDGKKYLGPKIKGKNIVILGDTAPIDLSKYNFLYKADILIHESTLDSSMCKKANLRGHSTNIQAALLAKECCVKKLIMTHFSLRYTKFIHFKNILKECLVLFPNIKIAYDFSIFKI